MSLDKENADKIIDFYNHTIKNGVIQFTGGEPLANWDIVSYIMDNTNAKFIIQTNGSLITKEIAAKLANKEVLVLLSIDGETEQDNAARKFLSGKNAYEAIIRGYEIAKEQGCKVGLSMVATEINVERLCEIAVDLKNRLQPDSFGFNIPHYTKYNHSDVDIIEYTRQMKKIFEFAKKEEIYIDQIARRLKPFVLEKFRLMDCTSCGEQAVFFPSGLTTNCVNYPAYDRSYALNRWEKAVPLHRRYCQDCPAIGICGGGCIYDGIKRYPEELDLRNCYYTKNMLEFFLYDILKEMKNHAFDYSEATKVYYGILGFKNGNIISAGHETNSDTMALNRNEEVSYVELE